MRVNFPITISNFKPLIVGLVLVFGAMVVFTTTSSFWVPIDRDAKMKQVNLLVRRVGDQLLLQSGDKTSRVLPVVEETTGTFVLRFENELRFNHDSLMALSYRLLPKTQFPSGYTVTVHDCENDAIVFGFAFSKKEDILACSGRVQPPGCYAIEFTFPDFASEPGAFVPGDKKSAWFTSPLALVSYAALFGMAVLLLVKRFRSESKQTPVSGLPTLGKFLFDAKEQRLFLNHDITSLTDKECKVLELLHENFGELIPRDTLMQKVWIDEGVITGRSLDMFISKLRKKLSQDPELKITNVHGKGYKLELVA